jgi:hypothetical protein
MGVKEDFQTSAGFAYLQIGPVTLVAVSSSFISSDHAQLEIAWQKFNAEVHPQLCLFVNATGRFKDWLARKDFQFVKVGHEPWVDLTQALPTGNAAKTLRAARNQALRSQLSVVEWKSDKILASPEKQQTLSTLFQNEKTSHLLSMNGFINQNHPLHELSERRFFVVVNAQQNAQGYLVVKPISAPGESSSGKVTLEDLVLDAEAPNGASDLLIVETLQVLIDSAAETGITEASLGAVQATKGKFSFRLFLVSKIPGYLKRAHVKTKPTRWEPIYLCLKNQNSSTNLFTWLKAIQALYLAFQPEWNFNRQSVAIPVRKSLRRHPISWGFFALSFLLFAFVNHFGELPESMVQRFSFSASAPWWQWFYRSLVSDFLFFNAGHFWFIAVLYFFALRWLERTQRLRFVIPFIFLTHLLDDFVNYFLIIQPFHFFEASLYHKFISYKDVGCSLCLMVVIGFQINLRARRHREFIFVLIVLALLMGSLFTTLQFTSLVLNINHLVFMLLGYLVGKLKFEQMRRDSKKLSKSRAISTL